MKLLFVCTANIARSPYAEYRARQLLPAGITVASAGIPGYPGRAIDSDIAVVLLEHGLSAAEHVSRVLDAGLISEADVILTMQFSHHMAILDSWPEAAPKTFGLRQFARGAESVRVERVGSSATEIVAAVRAVAGPNSMTQDVPDPHRRGIRMTRKATAQIDDALRSVGRLVGG